MKLIQVISSVIILLLFAGCANNGSGNQSSSPNDMSDSLNKNFNINPSEILKDYQTWYDYTYYNISLSPDFIGLNTDSSIIDKSSFLNSLLNNKTVALKIKLHNGIPVYKLYMLGSGTGEIASQSQHLA
ncbi:MAG: hypothetical protein QM668_07830, partial [Agriterribacter sp.]